MKPSQRVIIQQQSSSDDSTQYLDVVSGPGAFFGAGPRCRRADLTPLGHTTSSLTWARICCDSRTAHKGCYRDSTCGRTHGEDSSRRGAELLLQTPGAEAGISKCLLGLAPASPVHKLMGSPGLTEEGQSSPSPGRGRCRQVGQSSTSARKQSNQLQPGSVQAASTYHHTDPHGMPRDVPGKNQPDPVVHLSVLLV